MDRYSRGDLLRLESNPSTGSRTIIHRLEVSSSQNLRLYEYESEKYGNFRRTVVQGVDEHTIIDGGANLKVQRTNAFWPQDKITQI